MTLVRNEELSKIGKIGKSFIYLNTNFLKVLAELYLDIKFSSRLRDTETIYRKMKNNPNYLVEMLIINFRFFISPLGETAKQRVLEIINQRIGEIFEEYRNNSGVD